MSLHLGMIRRGKGIQETLVAWVRKIYTTVRRNRLEIVNVTLNLRLIFPITSIYKYSPIYILHTKYII
jgi:hypothetical protein